MMKVIKLYISCSPGLICQNLIISWNELFRAKRHTDQNKVLKIKDKPMLLGRGGWEPVRKFLQ